MASWCCADVPHPAADLPSLAFRDPTALRHLALSRQLRWRASPSPAPSSPPPPPALPPLPSPAPPSATRQVLPNPNPPGLQRRSSIVAASFDATRSAAASLLTERLPRHPRGTAARAAGDRRRASVDMGCFLSVNSDSDSDHETARAAHSSASPPIMRAVALLTKAVSPHMSCPGPSTTSRGDCGATADEGAIVSSTSRQSAALSLANGTATAPSPLTFGGSTGAAIEATLFAPSEPIAGTQGVIAERMRRARAEAAAVIAERQRLRLSATERAALDATAAAAATPRVGPGAGDAATGRDGRASMALSAVVEQVMERMRTGTRSPAKAAHSPADRITGTQAQPSQRDDVGTTTIVETEKHEGLFLGGAGWGGGVFTPTNSRSSLAQGSGALIPVFRSLYLPP